MRRYDRKSIDEIYIFPELHCLIFKIGRKKSLAALLRIKRMVIFPKAWKAQRYIIVIVQFQRDAIGKQGRVIPP
ncbi:hypothetical protein EAH79_13735 [Sphingomonas koreensis]|nr:hypothetical protein EAH79_13735 [Sphingomonas koreensis]